MKYTLLEMVQLILSAMDSDEVTSISDTTESLQVALLIKGVYYDIASDISLPEHETLFQLTASGDNTKPCLMTIPSNVVKVRNIKYDYKATGDTYPDYNELSFLPFEDFLLRQNSLREHTSGVGKQTVTLGADSFDLMFRNDKDPQYYTTADDFQFFFDSFDSSKDTTLAKSKTLCMGNAYPSWTQSDSFVPDLDATQFSLLINRAKVRAFNEIKQQINQEAAGEARRQKVISQKSKRRTPDRPEIYNVKSRFGRK